MLDRVERIRLSRRIGRFIVNVQKGDITEFDVDAVINAANSDLWMGSGVAGAIKSKGGTVIEQEAMAQGPIRPGEAVITTGGSLKARHVIHCAGMPPGGHATYSAVKSSMDQAIRLADSHGLKSIAVPAIGAGVGGLTVDDSIRAILLAVSENCESHGSLTHIILVGYNDSAYKAIEEIVYESGE